MNDEIESPCSGICTIDPSNGECIGWGRAVGGVNDWARCGDLKKNKF